MTYFDVSPKNHPKEFGDYDPDTDIIELWLSGKTSPRTVNRLINHETMHMVLDSVECTTTTEQDHYIIDDLEASGDLGCDIPVRERIK